ncbi:conjugal transfer protein TraF [Vibrio sp. PNB22_3_1]
MNRKILACAAMMVPSLASASVSDARSAAMGGVGVISGSYLTAGVNNPALGSMYAKSNDDFGLMLPAVSLNVQDPSDALGLLEDGQDLYDQIGPVISPDQDTQLTDLLDELATADAISVRGGAALAVSIPNQYMSASFHAKSSLDVVGSVDIDGAALTSLERYETSTVDLLAFGVAEVGVTLSQQAVVAGHNVVYGLTPKYQSLVIYSQSTLVQDFDLDNYDESEVTESGLNLDLGAIWWHGPHRIGLAVKNVFEQSVAAKVGDYKYELSPHVTLGVGYVTDRFTVALDADLTEQGRFSGLDDEEQWVRLGSEFDLYWASLRVGYAIDLLGTYGDTLTAGVGLSPFELVRFDVAVNYADETELGVAATMSLTL